MRALSVAILILVITAGPPAAAQQGAVTGATMLWYGVYTVGKTEEVKDPNSAGGTRLVSGGIVGPSVNADRIAVGNQTRFGFGYGLLGKPGNAIVPIVHVTVFEGAGGLDGKGMKTERINYDLAINQDGLFIGRRMGEAASEPTGVYRFQVMHKNKVLLEKQITIYKP